MFRSLSRRAAAAGLLASALLSFGLLAGASPTATAEGRQNFTLVNSTGYTINEVYVAPTKSDSWEEDVLGRDVLYDGERIDIVFSRKETSCLWDLMVVYDDGEQAEWSAFDLCSVSVIAISWDPSTGRTWATYE